MQDIQQKSVPLALSRIDALPLLLGLGILGYSAMEEEPSWWLLAGIPVWGSLVLLHRQQPPMRDGALAMLAMIIGLCAALWQTQRVDAPVIPDRYKPWEVTGTVMSVTPDEGKAKLLVAVTAIEGLEPEKTPRQVRISVRGKQTLPEAGDSVHFRGILYSPSPPLIPGGFDFARYFYYRGIGAVGYALPPVQVHAENTQSGVLLYFSHLRTSVQSWLLAEISQPTSGIAMALLTGDQSAVDEKTRQSFRVSSLAHILSISGMHMSIVCGMLFLVLRTLLSLIPPVALRANVKKISAIVALSIGAAYLLLADFPTPAVRAYVMVAFFFCGVLLDREALTVRSLVWAAVVILLVQPSSLIEPSFQLSFAATLALIVAYRNFAASRFTNRPERGSILQRLGVYFGGIVLSSLVASAATAPFIAYHFNQFAPYGVLANLLALPLLSFIIMPALLCALLLWPFALHGAALDVVEWGLQRMVEVARWVEHIPGASWYVPPVSDEAFVAAVAGLFLVLLGTRRWRMIGAVAAIAAMATAILYIPPDILVSDDGRQLAINVSAARSGKAAAHEGEEWVLVRGKSNRNFVVEQWQQHLGVKMATYRDWSKAHTGAQPLVCDEEQCRWGGFTFPMRGRILVRWPKGEVRWPELDRKGAHAIWLKEQGPRVVTGCDHAPGRPWKGCR